MTSPDRREPEVDPVEGPDPLADLFAADLSADPVPDAAADAGAGAASMEPEPEPEPETQDEQDEHEQDAAALASARGAWERALRAEVDVAVADWLHAARPDEYDRRPAARAELERARRELADEAGDLVKVLESTGRLAGWRADVLGGWLAQAQTEFDRQMAIVGAAQTPGAAVTDSPFWLLHDLDQAEAELGGLLALCEPDRPRFRRRVFEREAAAARRRKDLDVERERGARLAARQRRAEEERRRANLQLLWMLVGLAAVFLPIFLWLVFRRGWP